MENYNLSRRRFLKMAGTATGGILLVACGAPAAGPATGASDSTAAESSSAAPAAAGSSSPNTLRWGHWDDGYIGKQFPWTMAGGVNHTPLVKMSHEGPFFRNANLELEPNLIESAEYNDDFTAFTVKVKEGLKWSDGEPVTAHDIYGTVLMTINPESSAAKGVESSLRLVKGGNEYYLGESSDPPAGLIVEDDQTITFELIEPWSDAIWNILGGQQTMPWHIYKPVFDDPETRVQLRDFETPMMLDPKMQVGTGPYIFESGEKAVYMRYVKNPNYHGEAPSLDAVEFITYGSADACLVAFERGEIDVMATSDANYVPSLEAIADASIFDESDYYIRFLRYNWNKPYLNDPRVYAAIDMALDRQVLCEQVLKGACVAWREYGPGTEGFDHNPYNPEEAKRLLAEAGWDSSRQLELITDYTDTLTGELLAAMSAMLSQVGINATPRVLQGPALTEYYYGGNVDLWYDGSWGIAPSVVSPGQYDPPLWVDEAGNEFDEFAAGRVPKGGNLFGFHPEWVQELTKEYRSASAERQTEILKEIQERTATEGGSWMNLARYKRWLAYKNTVHGLDNIDTLLWNFDVFTNKSMAWTWSKDA
jgi:ABC-type transport system substrate-binding protein